MEETRYYQQDTKQRRNQFARMGAREDNSESQQGSPSSSTKSCTCKWGSVGCFWRPHGGRGTLCFRSISRRVVSPNSATGLGKVELHQRISVIRGLWEEVEALEIKETGGSTRGNCSLRVFPDESPIAYTRPICEVLWTRPHSVQGAEAPVGQKNHLRR